MLLCVKRSAMEKVETILLSSRRPNSAVPQICADQTFMKRMTGNFLREPWRIGLGAIDAECSGKKIAWEIRKRAMKTFASHT